MLKVLYLNIIDIISSFDFTNLTKPLNLYGLNMRELDLHMQACSIISKSYFILYIRIFLWKQ